MRVIKFLFDEYRKSNLHKQRIYDNHMMELNGPFLYSAAHLDSLLKQADSKGEQMHILDHMYKFNACEVDSYKRIEDKIIDRWR